MSGRRIGKKLIYRTASPLVAAFGCAEILRVTGVRRTANPNKRDGLVNLMIASDPDPRAYKDIRQVMADQSDPTEVPHVLTQVLNYKGTG